MCRRFAAIDEVRRRFEDFLPLFEDPVNEILWLSSVAWNLGIAAIDDDNADSTVALFSSSYEA